MTTSRQDILDLYFIDARHKLIDLAAFLDRVGRAKGGSDYRWEALMEAIPLLLHPGDEKADRAERVLLALSDPTTEPIAQSPGKGAAGAWLSPPPATNSTPTTGA